MPASLVTGVLGTKLNNAITNVDPLLRFSTIDSRPRVDHNVQATQEESSLSPVDGHIMAGTGLLRPHVLKYGKFAACLRRISAISS